MMAGLQDIHWAEPSKLFEPYDFAVTRLYSLGILTWQ